MNQNELIRKIAERAYNMYGCDKLTIIMDITYCIKGGCNLNLEDLLNANDFNFGHDIVGIHKHLNHETLSLDNCFIPRFAI